MKKILSGALIVLVLLSIAFTQRAEIAERVMRKGLESRMQIDVTRDFADGLHLALCGAGGPMPAPKASGPCVTVVAGKRLFIVDAGTDGLRNLSRMGYPTGSIEAVFLTHFHSDHIDGLGELATIRWVSAGNQQALPVYGPQGVENVVDGFNKAYQSDARYRQAHHGNRVAPLSGAGMLAKAFIAPAEGTLITVLEDDDLKIEALTVKHSPVEPAVAYRFRYKDRSLLITGDTVKLASIEDASRGVDLLVHEALAPNLLTMMHEAAIDADKPVLAKVFLDVLDYHTSPREAAQTARNAGVGHLLYYHIVPPIVFPGQETLFLNGADTIFDNYTVGQDGTAFSLPAGSKDILQTSSDL
ncbi:MAG: MBL fold metallo-hydrolase [Congregibacter sp.]|nr:MBL fold metallo-hydrolase [Congregibacter sp.]